MARRMRTRVATSTAAPLGGRLRTADVRGVASHGGLPCEQVSEMQRSRLLAGAVGAIDEYGFAGATVSHITARAKVSRRTFYELFEDREACVAALIEDVLATLEAELAQAGLEDLPWRDRVRGGLAMILEFLDREPVLARVCVVQVLSSGPRVLRHRDGILARLAQVLDEGRRESSRGQYCTALTAEGLVGAAFGIVHARLLRDEQTALLGLVGELMGLIVLPYLGAAAARREQARLTLQAPVSKQHRPPLLRAIPAQDLLQGLQMRWTYRTTRVMLAISEQPGASNRGVANYAGIHDQGQVSKLLSRLQRLGLITNTGDGHFKGEPNAWRLTPLGQQVVAQHLHTDIPTVNEKSGKHLRERLA